MVTGHSTGETGRHADEHKRAGGVERAHHDGNENAEGGPGSAGGEGQNTCHHEDNGRQEVHQTSSGVLHVEGNELTGFQRRGHVLERRGQGQDKNSRHHGDK